MTSKPLKLAAEDAEDLEVLSARLQDAVAQVQDLIYLPKKKRFAALFNRFKWEDSAKAKSDAEHLRVRAGLHFDRVLGVKSHNIKLGAPDAVISLLAIRYTAKDAEDPSGTIELVFAGGGAIRLEVECVDAELGDVSTEWAARGRPEHGTEEA
ncbi:MAG TPA: DUF2948 family protein [Rhizomicrobium sp.]|jgi:hypothetical protein|nr:DUF2948 family protein [Rhizomicrobium sp.]